MFCDDITPKPTPNYTGEDFAAKFPILVQHFGLHEMLAWQRQNVDEMTFAVTEDRAP